jgi:glycosyltransferase involved in cell wall biosynthesis
MKLLIQHTHRENEIAGVLTYINEIEPELNAQGVETQIISTKTTSIKKWIQAIADSDLVHMNSNHLGFALLCKLLGKQIILKYHYLFYTSTHFNYEKMSFSERLRTEFIQTLPKRNYPLKWKFFTVIKWARFGVRFATALLADRHTTCSNFLTESLSFPWKVSTLYNPISIQEFTKKELNQPYQFTYVGRLAHDKGVDFLLRAAKRLTEWNYEFQILIIGDGELTNSLKALAIKLEIVDRVQFLGHRSSNEILETVASSLALVVPSRWQEPAGYVTLEASSVQTCSIVANVGGLPEMAGFQNLFFERENVQELAARMKACLDNPMDAIDRGKQAHHYIKEQFSSTKITAQLLDICQEFQGSSHTLK